MVSKKCMRDASLPNYPVILLFHRIEAKGYLGILYAWANHAMMK